MIQRKFSPEVTRVIAVGAIIIAIAITGILGIRSFNKSDIWKPNTPVNINNPINSGNYCQQDSDCVLVPQYQGCCSNGCEVEAVNVETKKRDKEARNKICGIKDYSRCKMPECAVPKQAVCEQNRCVVKEKQIQNPTSKKQYKIIGSFTSPGESSFVKAMGIIVYLTDISEGLLAIDVSNPEKPILLSKIKIGNGGAYALSGNFNFPYVIVSGYGNNKVALGRVGHTGANEIVESTDAKRTVQDIVMEGDYIYLAIDGPEIEIMKVERGPNFPYDDAKKIINKGLMKVEGGGHINTLVEYWDSKINKPYLLAGQGESGISYYDLMKPAAPKLITHISNIGYVNIAALKDNFAYVSADGNLKIIDLRNQKVISDINVGEIWSLKIKNNLLYVASGENGVKVLDISDIRNPKQIALIDTPGRARSIDVSVDGKYIYVADDRDDLQIIKKD